MEIPTEIEDQKPKNAQNLDNNNFKMSLCKNILNRTNSEITLETNSTSNANSKIKQKKKKSKAQKACSIL